jgi:hypothetical protein
VADRGEFRIAPYVSSAEELGEEDAENVIEYGGLLGVGTGDKVEIQLRHDRFDGTEEDDDPYNFTSLGVKIGAVPEKLGVVLPIGVYWGGGLESSETVQIMPSLIGTAPVSQSFEVFGSAKLIYPFSDDLFTWFTLGFGAAVGPDVKQWAIIPEIDFSWEMEDDVDIGTWFRFGVALAFFPGGGGE